MTGLPSLPPTTIRICGWRKSKATARSISPSSRAGERWKLSAARQFAGDRDLLAAIYDRPDNIPYVTRHGGLLYNLWKDTKNPRGLWRRTTIAEFRKPNPQWDVVLDVDKLAAEENQDWLLNWTQPLAGNIRAPS